MIAVLIVPVILLCKCKVLIQKYQITPLQVQIKKKNKSTHFKDGRLCLEKGDQGHTFTSTNQNLTLFEAEG